ncbi:YnfA family protein [Nitrosarchaeum sp. AC2]|uniref:YnfA family protein n=1 Tax=Nitrosarchaeum sp. AC2 TaxID=2259673 RepID=UPI0015C961DE|nr:YnfA family protein [Nitrosarchaeum sp. AC2]QLH10274.1 YnfA family protein [Nitrosarchaeum sp. AC2]
MNEVIFSTLGLFFFASLLEIGGGYLVWKWLRVGKGKIFGMIGGLILFSYGIIMTMQPENFGKVYATYGGIFVVSSIIWGYWVDKKKPDRFEIIGSIVVLIGVTVMFYFPR